MNAVTGLVLLFDLYMEDPASSPLIAASVVDEDACETFFGPAASAEMREGWAENVQGKWEYAPDKTPSSVAETIAYNMIMPVTYEEFTSRDEAKARADELLSADPPITTGTYVGGTQ